MKINEFIKESTTAGAIATVSAPMTTQSRNASIYGGKKVGNLLTGKKTNKKYANSISESKMKQVASDLETMQDGNFKQKYGKTKEQIKMLLGDPRSGTKTVHENMDYQTKKELLRYPDAFALVERLEKAGVKVLEVRPGGESTARFLVEINGRQHLLTMSRQGKLSEAHLEEDDLILVPGQGHRLKTGFHSFDPDKAEHEGETLKNSLRTIARNAKELHGRLEDSEQFPEWVSEKIGTIKGMMTAVTEYLISQQEGDAAPEMEGVIAGGGVGESLANWQMGVQSIPRTTEWKRKAITAVMPGAFGKEYTFDTEQEAIQHFGKDAWEKIKSGAPTRSGKPWEVIYADDVNEEGKGLWANIHAKRERIKKGSGERMRKPGSKGAPSAQDFKDAANEGAMTTKQPKGEKPWKPSMDRPKGEYDPIYGKAPRKGTVAYNAWKSKRDAALKGDLSEAQTMSGALKNSLAKAEPGSKLDQSIKRHNSNIKAGQAGTLKNAPTGYHFDKKGYCRLGDK